MIGGTATAYALRSLRQNRRRTVLSVLGLGFGVGIGLIAMSWIGGVDGMSIRALSAGGIGHIRIAPTGWNEHRDHALRLTDGAAELEHIRARDGVAAAAPHARVGGLLGLGTRTSHVTLTGVDAATEPRVLRYITAIDEGRYLEPDEEGAIVIGRTIAERLHTDVGDELVVTSVDDEGNVESAILVVTGIVATGSRTIDASIAHVSLADVERLSGRAGIAEITILLDDLQAIDATRDALAPTLQEGNVALTWLELAPDFRSKRESGRAFMNIAIAIVLLVVLLGVASAQLTGVLERKKEFAVLAALGMPVRSLVRVVITEGAILGALGALAALVWTSPILRGWATNGIDLSTMVRSDEPLAMGGVLIDPMYFPVFGPWVVPAALLLSLVATVLASLYPARFAARTDPASALRVDR